MLSSNLRNGNIGNCTKNEEGMYYRLSNTASRTTIVETLDRPFKYPQLYEPRHLINGLSESSVSVITMDEANCINFAIWGLMPKQFRSDWSVFQNTCNTLNLSGSTMNRPSWYRSNFETGRCLIIATGFFTSYLYHGEIYPYYMHINRQKPFCLAGIYNRLDDGFLSCAVVTSEAVARIQKFQNLSSEIPLIIPTNLQEKWLDNTLVPSEVSKLMEPREIFGLKAYPIGRELYNQDIVYESMLDPVYYPHIPLPQED